MDTKHEEILDTLAQAIWQRVFAGIKHGNCAVKKFSWRVDQIVDRIVDEAAGATKDES